MFYRMPKWYADAKPRCHKVFPVMKEDFSESPMLWCASTDCDSYWCKACSQQAERDQKHTCDGQAELERWKLEQKDVRDCPGRFIPTLLEELEINHS